MKLVEIPILLFSLLLAIPPPAKGQLEAILTPTKLPRGMVGAALAYDGDDSIYLLGGLPVHYEILRYSVSSGVLEVVGTNPAFGFGIAETDRNGNPIFLSAGTNYTDVVRFNRFENTTELLATHSYEKYSAASIKNGDMVLIIGGIGKANGLLTFDTATLVSTVKADLPVGVFQPTAVRVGHSAFVFDINSVLKIDLETFSSEVIIAPGGFPFLNYQSRAVYDGRNIYIIGGHSGRTIPTGGIIQFNPDNYEWKFAPVENFPVSSSLYFEWAPASVYVEKMHRIYMFGGHIYTSPVVSEDSIWYIDLNPENPTTTGPTTTGTTTSDLPETTTRSSAALRPFPSILEAEFVPFLILIAKIINSHLLNP